MTGAGAVGSSQVDEKDYVWTAEGAKRLRKSHRIMGSMVGGICRYSQQSAVKGLPLQLSEEELFCAQRTDSIQQQDMRRATDRQILEVSESPNAETCSGSDEDDQAAATMVRQDMSWIRGVTPDQSAIKSLPDVMHPLPISTNVQMRAASPSLSSRVYHDLQQRGYCITQGSKFGADFLLYPGDPILYHAQFCTRLLEPCQKLNPGSIVAASRGSHIARKNLLLAFATGSGAASQGDSLHFLSMAPEKLGRIH
ncbi:hypothetical protein WJX74_007648 [Apatococcus lobatus]|uniref:tRNA-intron lyase n=1 Tax=Apatococcus lobatus TaxID=904363 RepID=A0AAW1RFE1_9CHLO